MLGQLTLIPDAHQGSDLAIRQGCLLATVGRLRRGQLGAQSSLGSRSALLRFTGVLGAKVLDQLRAAPVEALCGVSEVRGDGEAQTVSPAAWVLGRAHHREGHLVTALYPSPSDNRLK